MIPSRMHVSTDGQVPRPSVHAVAAVQVQRSVVRATVLGEYFIPGGYYVAPSDDDAFFLRFNFEYIF